MERLWTLFCRRGQQRGCWRHDALPYLSKRVGSALKPEDDILWACGQYMLDRKIPIPIRSSGVALKLVLMPTCLLRRQGMPSMGVNSVPGDIFSGRANRIICFHLLNGIREGQFSLSLESYAFITALIHSIFNQTLPELFDKTEIYHTMKRCVPLKILVFRVPNLSL